MNYAGFQSLTVELMDGVAHVVIDNPPINLFDLVLYPEMVRLSAELRDDEDVRAVVVSSENPEFFIAHFDVSRILQLPTGQPAPTARHRSIEVVLFEPVAFLFPKKIPDNSGISRFGSLKNRAPTAMIVFIVSRSEAPPL